FPICGWLAMPESDAYSAGPITTEREAISARRACRFHPGRDFGPWLLLRHVLRPDFDIRRIEPPVPPSADHFAHAFDGHVDGHLGAFAGHATDHGPKQKLTDPAQMLTVRGTLLAPIELYLLRQVSAQAIDVVDTDCSRYFHYDTRRHTNTLPAQSTS